MSKFMGLNWGESTAGITAELQSLRKLLEADHVLQPNLAGVYKMHYRERGTNTELMPEKTARQPSGGALTDPTSQLLASLRED